MIEYKYLRPEKARHLKQRADAAFPETKVNYNTYDDATILPLKKCLDGEVLFGYGGVKDSQDKFIEASGIVARFWGSYPTDDVEIRNETVVYCGLFMQHWGHFFGRKRIALVVFS